MMWQHYYYIWVVVLITIILIQLQITELESKVIFKDDNNNNISLPLLTETFGEFISTDRDSSSNSHNNNNATLSSSSMLNQNITKGPPIVIGDSLQTMTAIARDNVELKCPITSDPPPFYDWFKGKDRIDSSWERFDLSSSNNGRNILYIRSVTHEDKGEYICEAINGYGKNTARIKLNITGEDPFKDNFLKTSGTKKNGSNNESSNLYPGMEKPEILIELLPKDRNMTLTKGTNITLKCEAKGNPVPNVVWFKDNTQIANPKSEVAILKLANLTENDSGIYTCEAVSFIGKAIYEVSILIEGSWPRHSKAEIIELSPRNLTLFPGENGSIKCVAKIENEFQPYFFWVKKTDFPSQAHKKLIYHNGSYFEVIGRSEITESIDDIFTTDLVFNNVSKVDAGSYHCVVTGHMVGYTHSEAHVFVYNDPMQVLSVQLSKERAITIQWAVFACLLFLIIAALLITCIYRMYTFNTQVKPFNNNGKQSRLCCLPFICMRKKNGNVKSNVPITIHIPKNSPGETTVSTSLSRPPDENNTTNDAAIVEDLLTMSSSTRTKYYKPSKTNFHSQSYCGPNTIHPNLKIPPSLSSTQNYYDTTSDYEEMDMYADYNNGELSESDLSSYALNGESNSENPYFQDTAASSCLLHPKRSHCPQCNNCSNQKYIDEKFYYRNNNTNNKNCYGRHLHNQQQHCHEPLNNVVHNNHCKNCHHYQQQQQQRHTASSNINEKRNHHYHGYKPRLYYSGTDTPAESTSSITNVDFDENIPTYNKENKRKRKYKIHYHQPPSSPVSFLSNMTIDQSR